MSFVTTRQGGFNNSNESLTVEPDNLVAFAYKTEFYYDFNDNLIATFIENRPSADVSNDTVDDHPGPGGLLSSPAFLTLAYPNGKDDYIEYYNDFDILDNLLRSSQEIGPGDDVMEDVIYTSHRYDANENPIAIIYPAGNIFTSAYNERDLLNISLRGDNDTNALNGSTNTIASTVTHLYDNNGNLSKVIDAEDNMGRKLPGYPNGDLTDYSYDGYDRLSSVKDAMGNETFNFYDAHSNITSVERWGPVTVDDDNSSTGNTQLERTFFRFDELERMYQSDREILAAPFNGGTVIPVPGGTSSHFVSTLQKLDAMGRVVERTEDDGNLHKTIYDGLGRTLFEIDPEKNEKYFGYDDNNNLVLVAEKDWKQTSLPMGMLDRVYFSNTFYDTLNRKVMLVDNIGQAQRFRYDSRNNLRFLSDAVDGTGLLQENSAPIEIDRPEFLFGGTPGTGTPGFGPRNINSHGNVSRYQYDGINRLLSTKAVLTASGVGNGSDSPVADNNQGGGDGLIVMQQFWDKNSRLEMQTDDKGNETKYLYDVLNRQTTVVFESDLGNNIPETQRVTAYDKDDNISSITDQNGSLLEYTYDGVNRRTLCEVTQAVNVIGTTEQNWEYDGLSRVIFAQDNHEDGLPDDGKSKVSRTYDSLSRILTETQDIFADTARTVAYSWGPDSKLLGLDYPTDPDDSSFSFVSTYTYDSLDRIKQIRSNNTNQGSGGLLYSVNYVGQNRPYETQQFADNGGFTVKTYDEQRRMVSQDLTLFNGFGSYNNNYDRANNLKITRKRLNDTGDIFLYDSSYRLRRKDKNVPEKGTNYLNPSLPGFTPVTFTTQAIGENLETWKLDGVNNWLEAKGQPGGICNQADNINVLNEYEEFDHYNQKHDQNGNLTEDHVRNTPGSIYYYKYSYDAFTRLRRVDRVIGQNPPVTLAVYKYDAFGRRVSRFAILNNEPADTVEYYYNGSEVLVDAHHLANNNYQQIYINGTGIDEPVGYFRRYVASSLNSVQSLGKGGSEPFRYYFYNAEGSVAGVFNEDGYILERYDYDAFGRPEFLDPNGDGWLDMDSPQSVDDDFDPLKQVGNPYLFSGRRWDPETADFLEFETTAPGFKKPILAESAELLGTAFNTGKNVVRGLYYFRARQYHPTQGRFMQRDPIGMWGDPMNLGNPYAYCTNNPISNSDPFGTITFGDATRGVYGFGKTVVVGGAVIVGVAAAATISVPVAIAGSTAFVIYGVSNAALNRYGAGQSVGQITGGTFADVTGVSGAYAGATGRDIATGQDLGLSSGERAEAFGGGVGGLALVAAGPKLFKFGLGSVGPRVQAAYASLRLKGISYAQANTVLSKMWGVGGRNITFGGSRVRGLNSFINRVFRGNRSMPNDLDVGYSTSRNKFKDFQFKANRDAFGNNRMIGDTIFSTPMKAVGKTYATPREYFLSGYSKGGTKPPSSSFTLINPASIPYAVPGSIAGLAGAQAGN